MNNEMMYNEKLEFDFENADIKNLGVVVGAGQFVIKTGTTYKIEAKGISKEDFRCELNTEGTLIIENKKIPTDIKRYENAIRNKYCPRVLITIPQKTQLENLKLFLSAGELWTKPISLNVKRAMIDVSAAKLSVDGLTSHASNINCLMGNIILAGSFKGYSKIDCTMGNIKILNRENQHSYSFDSNVKIGTIQFGSKIIKNFYQTFTDKNKKNHCQINTKMGDVKILF